MAEEVTRFLYGYNDLASSVYSGISPQEGNLLFSPPSLHQLLTLISQDAGYHYKEAFSSMLRIDDIEEVGQRYRDILAYLTLTDNGKFVLHNKAFLRESCELREAFKNILINNFCFDLEPLDFLKNETAVKNINLWVEGKTNMRTKSLITDRILNIEDRLALLTATNFEAKWADPFMVENTKSGIFHLNDSDTMEVQMMKAKREFEYKVDGYTQTKILKLPYTNDDLSVFFILPDKETTIKDVEEKLSSWDLRYFLEDMNKTEVDVSIPKFKIEKSDDFKNVLRERNLKDELSENADLFGMLDSDEFFYFNNIRQGASIDVNEEGTEAASGTIFTLVPSEVDEKGYLPKDNLIIYEMNIKSTISNRFAKNLVVSKVKNTDKVAKEATFSVVLPETAFITEFIMEIEGKSYKSLIKGKDEAKTIYKEALKSGKSAGIVEASTRDSNEFSVSVNLEPESVAVFSLTYEEMLQRICDQYELVLNICPGQFVEKLNVEVNIKESRPLRFVKTPPLRSGNEMNKFEQYLDPSADVKIVNSKSALVKFSPDLKRQKRVARYLGTNVAKGFAGQFVVQYDVERDPQDGEILLQDGYFVHFFAPNDLDPLPKHVVFVLDTSGSMGGRKISQLKDAMQSILSELRTNDIISLIEFNDDVVVWDINTETSTVLSFGDREIFQSPFRKLSEFSVPAPVYVGKETISKAKNVVQKMKDNGCTFMIGGLETALYLVNLQQEKHSNKSEKYQPIIVFLTDGEPNVGMSSTREIVETVTRLNFKYNKVPIFSLSFGSGADKEFLRQLSLKNMGFSRHIYEASDASLQLQAFYKQISSPLLSDVTFKYESDVKEVTRSSFPIYFRGAELVVSGRYEGDSLPTVINCCGPRGVIILKSKIERPVTSLERLWAYLTVKQLLEERKSVENGTELTKRAMEIALRYSFVTDVTSLVVVKPNETDAVLTEEDKEEPLDECGPTRMLCSGSRPMALSGDGAVRLQCCAAQFMGEPGNIMLCSGASCRALRRSEDFADMIQCCASMEERSARRRLTTFLPFRQMFRKIKRAYKKMRGTHSASESEEEPPKKEIPQEEFTADRPFIIVLLLKKGNERIILFMGRVSKPCY